MLLSVQAGLNTIHLYIILKRNLYNIAQLIV